MRRCTYRIKVGVYAEVTVLKVYRLENKEGYGPFYKKQTIVNLLTEHNDPDNPLMLKSAGLKSIDDLKNENHLVFGWKSKKLMYRFVKDFKIAKEYGYFVNCYEVDKWSTLRFYDGQVMFNKNTSVSVQEVDMR